MHSRRFLVLEWCCAVALLLASWSQGAEIPRNLLPYGDFETRGANGAVEGWTVEDWAGWSDAAAEVTGKAWVGKGCLRMTAKVPMADLVCYSPAVTIPRGEPLLLTAWYRTDKDPRAQLTLVTFREGFAQTRWATPPVLATVKTLPPSNRWRAVALRVEASDAAHEAVALIRIGREGALRIDDVRLTTAPRGSTVEFAEAGDVLKLPDVRSAKLRIVGSPTAKAKLMLVAEWGDGRTSTQETSLERVRSDNETIQVQYKCPAREEHRVQALLLAEDQRTILAEATYHAPALMSPRFTLPAVRPYIFAGFPIDEAQLSVDVAAGEQLRRQLSLEASLHRARLLEGGQEPREGRSQARDNVRAPLEPRNLLRLRVGDLPEGNYETTIRLKRGNDVVQQVELPLSKLGARPWEVPFDARGNLIADGLPFFPIAIHDVNTPEALTRVSEAGFNTVIVPTVYASTAFADHAEKLGLKLVVRAESVDTNRWLRLLSKFGRHPALLAWGAMDSPDNVPVPPDQFRALYQFITQSDPYHPVSCAPGSAEGVWDYGAAADIIVVNRYLIPHSKLSTLAREIALAKAAVHGEKPVWVGIQACPRPGVPAEAAERIPLPSEYRCLVYLAIVSGAQGLGTLVYHMPESRNGPAFTLPDDAPELWQEVKAVNGELRFWIPALVAPGNPQQPRVDAEGVNVLLKREANQLVLFAVNSSDLPRSATIVIPGVGSCTAKAPFEDRSLEVGDDGTLEDDFEPYGVHVYTLPLPSA